MKKTRIILSLFLASVLALCACGGTTAPAPAAAESTAAESTTTMSEAEETPKAEESAAAKPDAEFVKEESEAAESTAEIAVEPLPIAGEYELYAVNYTGYLVYASEMEMASTLILKEDGTGSMSMDADTMNVSSWTSDDGTITITMEDESSANATAPHSGVIELDIYGDGEMILVYSQEKGDLSSYSPLTAEEVQTLINAAEENAATPDTGSKICAYWNSLYQSDFHLSYEEVIKDFQNYGDIFYSVNVHRKGSALYEEKISSIPSMSDYTTTDGVLIKDDNQYILNPDKKTGTLTYKNISSMFGDRFLVINDLCSHIYLCAVKENYTEETREYNGTTYTCEVFAPESDSDTEPESAFYYDENGQLAYYIMAPRESFDIGEVVYTILGVDEAVDESLFDISGYTIDEYDAS